MNVQNKVTAACTAFHIYWGVKTGKALRIPFGNFFSQLGIQPIPQPQFALMFSTFIIGKTETVIWGPQFNFKNTDRK